jgi:DNA-binding IclR family transcriptional regulator
MGEKNTQIIHSLDKGLLLLETIEQETYPVTLHALWKKMGWDKATILRMCNTLERRGYIRKDPSTKQYSLGLKIFGLYESILKHIDVQQMARQYLERIAQKTGESTHLAFFIEKSAVFIDKVVGSNDPPVNVQIGGREPLHCTAMGKAFLAFSNAPDLEQQLDMPLKKHTPQSIDSPEKIKQELERIKSRTYAVDNEEYIAGVRCIAAPIFNHTGVPVAAIGISAPKERLPDTRIERYGTIISTTAAELSEKLGFSNL